MTPNERPALSTLLTLRTQAREAAETSLAGALRALSVAEEARTAAIAAHESHRLASNDTLETARGAARTGADFIGVDSLGRAIREESARLRARIDSAEAAVRGADELVGKARGALAHAEAEEKAVAKRLAAVDSRSRALALAREDDEADERAARARHDRPREP